MPHPTIDFDDFIGFSLEEAARKFHSTNEYHLLKEKVEQMEEACKERFSENDYSFIEHCFETLLEAEGGETEFIYLQGYKDCVALLKQIDVL